MTSLYKPVTVTIRKKLAAWFERQASQPRKSLQQFTTGGFVFSIGAMMLLVVNQNWNSSLAFEWIALLAVTLIASGAVYALWGYLAISLFKILAYILDSEKH